MQRLIGYFFSLLLFLTLPLDAKSLLYKVSSEGSTVYVLGSIHLAKSELYPLNKAIMNAYNKSDVLVVEVDPSSQESVMTMQNSMVMSGMYMHGKTLKTELTPKTYKILQAYTSKANIPLIMLESMKPWVVMLQLTVTEMMRLGYSPEYGIDKHFLDDAKQQGKSVMELESAAEQMALLSRDDKDFQDKLLRYTLESMRELEPMLDEMYKRWKEGDAKHFNEIIFSPVEDDKTMQEVYYELITKRNYGMTEKIQAYLKTDKDYFVVVGAGHVVGDEGIISLLEKRGYTVTQH